jgi:hypothetical protein
MTEAGDRQFLKPISYNLKEDFFNGIRPLLSLRGQNTETEHRFTRSSSDLFFCMVSIVMIIPSFGRSGLAVQLQFLYWI